MFSSFFSIFSLDASEVMKFVWCKILAAYNVSFFMTLSPSNRKVLVPRVHLPNVFKGFICLVQVIEADSS